MTAVARVRILDAPCLVGDVVLTLDGKRLDVGAGKVYVVAPNVVLGWSGTAVLARPAFVRIINELGGRVATLRDIENAFDKLDVLRAYRGKTLDLTGWVITDAGAKGIRWTTRSRPPLFDEVDHSIGSGGSTLRGYLSPPAASFSNTEGVDVVPMKVIAGFMEGRHEEMLRGNAWPLSWGKAYDAIVLQKGLFRWLDKLTYIGWEVTVDGNDRVESVKQAPVVFTQERHHPCTVLFTKTVGDVRQARVELSTPVFPDPRKLDDDVYYLKPYTAVSPYYANYLRVHYKSEGSLVKLCLAWKHATSNGAIYHASKDPSDPTFEVNVPVLEENLRKALEEARRVQFVTPPAI